MGCDIHLHTERKIKGSWVNLHSDLGVDRNYTLFAILADVRNYGENVPINSPKGVPTDASKEYLQSVEDMDTDGHSHSYLTLQEILDYLPEAQVKYTGMISQEQSDQLDTGVLPTSWCRSTNATGFLYREWYDSESSLVDLVDNMKLLQCDVPDTDIRIVFYFDN